MDQIASIKFSLSNLRGKLSKVTGVLARDVVFHLQLELLTSLMSASQHPPLAFTILLSLNQKIVLVRAVGQAHV